MTGSHRFAHERSSRVSSLTRVAAVVALLAVSASLSIPIGPVPISLQMLVLFTAVMLMTPKQFLAAVAGYLLIGAMGLPVFTGFKGGVGALLGPTGGFLLGFLVAAVIIWMVFRDREAGSGVPSDLIKILIILATSYILGWLQLQVVTGMSPTAAFVAGIAPFVLIDIVKGAFAFFIARSVKLALGSRTEERSCS